jgi:predicted MFS family arabinose efflux permease
MRALALNSSAQSSAVILGPALGALLYSAIGVGGAFLATSLLQGITLVSIVALRWEGSPELHTPVARKVTDDIAQGIGYVRRDTVVLGLVALGAAAGLFSSAQITFLPVFAKEVLDTDARGLSLLIMASGVGTLTGGLLVAAFGGYRGKGRLLFAGGLGNALALLAFSSSRLLVLSVVALFIAGALATAYRTVTMTILQLCAPEELRGRVMGLTVTLQGLSPLGAVPIAMLVDWRGAPLALGVVGVMLAVLNITVAASNRRLRALEIS